MENATKALIIAAAILIAILIISLSLVVYNMAAEAVGDINLSEAEQKEFNGKFEQYEGSISGSKVNAMLKTVLSHNLANKDAGKKVSVTGSVTLGTTDTTLPDTKADTGELYTVKCTYDSDSGLITTISVSK